MDNGDGHDNYEDIFGFIDDPMDSSAAHDSSEQYSIGQDIFGGPSKDAVLFCVDCANLNVLFSGHETTPMSSTLTALQGLMRSKVIASDGSDMTGLILYNVGKTDNVLNQPGINTYQSLDKLTADRIQSIRSLLSVSGLDEFQSQFGTLTEHIELSDLLWLCSKIFRDSTTFSYRCRIFIFTDNDNPCPSRQSRKMALTRASDLHEGLKGCEINLVPLVRENFDLKIFWRDIILLGSFDDEEEGGGRFMESIENQISEISEIVRKKFFKKRNLNRINLKLNSKTNIAFSLYTEVIPAKPPAAVYVESSTGKLLKSETKFISSSAGTALDPTEIAGEVKTFIEWNGKRIKISKSDINEIKKILPDDPDERVSGSLNVIGFKSMNEILPFHSVTHSYFLHPQEDRISGSSMISSAFITRLHARGLVAICRFVARRNSPVSIVALLPQPEIIDTASDRQEKSPGFHLIRLPFLEDIRSLEMPQPFDVTPDQVDACKSVIESMSLSGWEPDRIDNPALQKKFLFLEAFALQLPMEEVVGQLHDYVQPDPARRRLADADGGPVDAWLDSMRLRPGESDLRHKPATQTKNEASVKTENLSDDGIAQLAASGGLEKFTVAALKEFIKNSPKLGHFPITGRKGELIDRIRNNI